MPTLYCIVCLLNVSFCNSGYSLIQTNIKEFQGFHKALHLLHKEHVHLFSWNQVIIVAEPSFNHMNQGATKRYNHGNLGLLPGRGVGFVRIPRRTEGVFERGQLGVVVWIRSVKVHEHEHERFVWIRTDTVLS